MHTARHCLQCYGGCRAGGISACLVILPADRAAVSAPFPAAPQRSSEAAEPQADNVNFHTQDLANFDLDFHLSDSDLGHFDVSADFFA